MLAFLLQKFSTTVQNEIGWHIGEKFSFFRVGGGGLGLYQLSETYPCSMYVYIYIYTHPLLTIIYFSLYGESHFIETPGKFSLLSSP